MSWQPHGYCFLIHNQDEFIKHVLPLFRHSEYASFRAQLKAYGFSRLGKHGPDKGGYYNEYFLRCMPELCAHIIRRPKNQHGTVRGRPKGAVSRADPNFYDMKPMPKGKDKLPRVPVEGNLFELLQSELTYIEPPPVTEAAPPAMNISNNKSKAYQGEAVAMPSKLSESALPSFPKRLYSLLEYASDNNLGRMITWSNDGHSFVVINENAFAKELLSPWLDICSYAQFEQELRDHGFELGLDGHWKHNMFLQSLPHLCAAIKRKGKNQKRKLDVDDGVDESKKAARKASIDSPRSSATVMTMGMGNSEFEIAMLLTSLDKKKKDEVVAAVLPPKSASTVSSSSSGSGSSCDSNIHQPSRVAPLVIAPPAQKGPRKPAADPPGRRCSVYSE